MKSSIVVFSPHPDDEVLGCGGTIAKKLSGNHSVFIIFMTYGAGGHEYRHYGKISGLTALQLREIRKQEAISADKALGVHQKNLIFLGIEDGKLRESKEKAEAKVAEILNVTRPAEIYFPHSSDPNEDHFAANRILQNSLRNVTNKPIRYEYVIWTIDELFKHQTFLIKAWLKAKRKFSCDSKMQRFDRVRVNISDYVPLKLEALQKYKSQTTVFFRNQKEPILKKSFVDKFLKNEEIFYRSV